ncbi:DUF262 domain-containing protein [Flavobacterium marginilacus]|uniref:DUF262 domain-containing protein n=1 Tax=Flavobacterium marginilacus TaxID=3003256 RepID=UPI00248DB46A|nr:DUF262 domain-containing protein [Flavobacterium marginilacus]
MSQLLYSVEEVFSEDGYLKELKKEYYNIPHYQRGYKWEPKNVQKLLEDIDNFKHANDKFYCLQNITIVEKENYFNVIDGQQRLTTLTILLSYLNKKELVFNKVRFPENSIRKETNSFLNKIITNTLASFPENSWEGFTKKNENYDHQDIYHIYRVYEAIEIWFDEKQRNEPTFDVVIYTEKLLNSVKLIINKVEGTTSEEKIFGNLNSKRVPLDGADLVRAILITRVANEEGKRESDIKNIVRVNERRVKIGWELDQINNWWSRDDVKQYFSNFVNVKSEEIGVSNKLFDEKKYPINNLYLLFAEKKGDKKLTLELIEKHNNDALGLYKEIVKLHSTLQDWFNDRKIYHFLGYLFNHKSNKTFNFNTVWNLWEKCTTRDQFIEKLKGLMLEVVSIDNELINFTDSNVNWYYDNPEKLVQTLVLMDVIYSLKENHNFLPHFAFTKKSNDIEHIFPQNPKEVEKQKEYIAFLNKTYVGKNKQFDLKDFDSKKNDEKYQEKIILFIKEQTSSFKINSVGNLVLLYSSLNRSISNSKYADKRARIISFYNDGNFIQPHTFSVFVRNFNDDKDENKDYEHWTNIDIESNAKFISKTIENFFNIQKP